MYTKIKIFLKANHLRFLAMNKNLKIEKINGNTQCARGGVDEEKTNHVLFKCPSANTSMSFVKKFQQIRTDSFAFVLSVI